MDIESLLDAAQSVETAKMGTVSNFVAIDLVSVADKRIENLEQELGTVVHVAKPVRRENAFVDVFTSRLISDCFLHYRHHYTPFSSSIKERIFVFNVVVDE